MTSSQLKQLNRQPELGMSVNRVWNGLSHYKHHRMTEAANQSRLPMGNKSKWRRKAIYPSGPTHHRISVAQPLYQNHQCLQCLEIFPASHPSINEVPLSTVRNPLDGFEDPYGSNFIVSSGLPQHNRFLDLILCHSLDLRTLMPTGTAELTRDMDLTLLKNWIPD